MREERLPESEGNIFAEIKEKRKELVTAGKKTLDFSIGIPPGSSSRIGSCFAALAHLLNEQGLAGYQDCGSDGVDAFFKMLDRATWDKAYILKTMEQDDPTQRILGIDLLLDEMLYGQHEKLEVLPNFSKEFCQHHLPESIAHHKDLHFAPTIGTKSMLGTVIMACAPGAKKIKVAVMTDPGYPTSTFWVNKLGHTIYQLPLGPENDFKLTPDMIPTDIDLLMIQYPNNPTGQILIAPEMYEVCEHCEMHGIRIFNDNPYSFLSPEEAVTLTEIALLRPNLSFLEAFSFSKEGGNHTGWSVGAVDGSEDFIADFKKIKGDVDSGFNVSAAVGALATLRYDKQSIYDQRDLYQLRQKFLRNALVNIGLQPVGTPKATFFSLWKNPKQAFGLNIEKEKDFFNALINHAGIITVPFDPYTRFATVSDNMDEETFQADFLNEIKKMNPIY